MNRRLADALAALLFAGILTCWAPGYWPVALVQAGAFLLLAQVLVEGRPVHTEFVALPVIGLVVWGAWQLTAGTSAYKFETGKALLYWAANAAAFLVAREACGSTYTRNRFLRGILWFGAALGLLTVVQYFTSEGRVFWIFPTQEARVLGPFLYKNQCAAFIELVFPLAVYQSLVDRRHSLVYVAMAATMFAVVIAAVSRAGVALVTAELTVILLLAWRRGLMPAVRLRKTVMSLAALSVVLAAVVGWQVTLEKFREPEPYRVRRELLISSLAMVADRPFAGFGLGTWPAVYPAYARFDNGLLANHAHNDWAEWAAEGGLPFLALAVMIAIWSVRPAAESLWGLGIAAIFAHSLVDYPLREPALAALLFAMLGALAARARGD
jgi:O-antigen ligase